MTTPEVVLTNRYADAVAYAAHLHASQSRKSTTIPYISHLLGVSSLVLEAGGDEDQAIAALLHDGPEDQGGQATLDEIRQRFGDRVAAIVEGCTDFSDHLKHADYDTLTVALADKLHNARATVTDLQITGQDTWERFNASPQETLWYYQQILDIAKQRDVPTFLEVNLTTAVETMRDLATTTP